MIAALLVLGALWFLPFSPHNAYFHVQQCVPIREALRHHPSGFPMSADLCHDGSVDRVTIGAFVGGVGGLTGLVMLLAPRTFGGAAEKEPG